MVFTTLESRSNLLQTKCMFIAGTITSVSRPTVIIIIQKRTAHSWGRGSLPIVSGYVMNISPGSKKTNYVHHVF